MVEYISKLKCHSAELGFGCGRLGSLSNDIPISESIAAIETAYAEGVRLFDTANIYGQGDSERILGRVLRQKDGVKIVTKFGRRLSRRALAFRYVKPLITKILKLASKLPGENQSLRPPFPVSLEKIRASEVVFDFNPSWLRRSFRRSLRRLRMPSVDTILLHDPPDEIILSEQVRQTLLSLRNEGKARLIGASIDCADRLKSAAVSNYFDIIQAPLDIIERECSTDIYKQLLDQGTRFQIRQVLSSARGRPSNETELRDRLKSAADIPGIVGLVIGLSRRDHLYSIMSAYDY